MMLWSTLVLINNEVSVQDFYGVFRDWILGSRYTRIKSEEYPCCVADCEMTIGLPNQQVLVFKQGDSVIGLRYENEDKIGLWVTEAVYAQSETNSICSIKLSCKGRRLSFKRPN